MASSSSRLIASGHQSAPAATMSSMVFGDTVSGARTVNVAVRALRSNCTSTYS